MMRLHDGTVQIIVRDGKIVVVGMNLGGGDMDFPEDDNDFGFQVSTLMAGMEYVLRMKGWGGPQSLDFDDPDDDGGPVVPSPYIPPQEPPYVKPFGLTETPQQMADRIAKLIHHRHGGESVAFPAPPPGL